MLTERLFQVMVFNNVLKTLAQKHVGYTSFNKHFFLNVFKC